MSSDLDIEKVIYKCSCCDRLFNWGKGTFWYGSLKDMDEDKSKLKYACSDKCKEKLENEKTRHSSSY